MRVGIVSSTADEARALDVLGTREMSTTSGPGKKGRTSELMIYYGRGTKNNHRRYFLAFAFVICVCHNIISISQLEYTVNSQ